MSIISDICRRAAVAAPFCVALALWCPPDAANALGRTMSQPIEETELVTSGSEQLFRQSYFTYYHLLGDEMSDVYEYLIAGCGAAGGWDQSEDGYIGRFGAKFEAGLLAGNGEAIPRSTNWQIDKADLSLFALPFDISILYRLLGTGEGTFAVPFVGVGVGGIVGWEKLSAAISRPGEAAGWENGNLRMSFESHVSVGTYLFASKKYKGLIEFKYVFSGKSGYDNGEVTEEMKNAGFTEDILAVIARPDFDFSGPAVSVGVEW